MKFNDILLLELCLQEDVAKFLEKENTTIERAIEAMQTLHR